MFDKKAARKPFRRLIAGAAATAALTVAGVIAVATPAMAAPGNCPSGYTCLWKDAGYVTNGNENNSFYFETGAADLRNYRWVFNGTVQDNVSSVYNNGNSEASFIFDNLNFQVQLSYFPIKFGKQYLGDANDRASSAGFRFCLNNPSSSRCQ